ncbi:hypothetical protein LNP25_23440 [Klebsiella variicola subsp. variicola]|nr:hypothetical protein [Klebsiella variicola subsp. variicola]
MTDQNVGALEATRAIHRLLAAEGRQVEVIDTVPAEPSHHDVAQIVNAGRQSAPDDRGHRRGAYWMWRNCSRCSCILRRPLTAMLAGEVAATTD